MAKLIPLGGKAPRIDPSAFVAPGAVLIGDVEVGPDASIWYNCVLRGDCNRIRIGARTNIQDGSVLHVRFAAAGNESAGPPSSLRCAIGHMAMVHGCPSTTAPCRARSIVWTARDRRRRHARRGALLAPGRRSRRAALGRPPPNIEDLSEESWRTSGGRRPFSRSPGFMRRRSKPARAR